MKSVYHFWVKQTFFTIRCYQNSMQWRPYFSIVILQLVAANLRNTSSSSTNSQSSDTPDIRSTMQNPCRGRISPRSEGLSLQDRQFLSSSLWKKCLSECRFSPTEEADALVQLVTQTGELKNHFDRFKDHFARRVFRTNYTSLSDAYSYLVLRWLIPSSSNISNVESNNPEHIINSWNNYQESGAESVLISAYNLFQRLAIAVELVWSDLVDQTQSDRGRFMFRQRKGRQWRLAIGKSNRIIEAIHMSLKALGSSRVDINNLMVHNRNVVSEPVRCIDIASETTRHNMRDFAILQNAVAITDHFRHMFVLYAQHRINHLISEASGQQSEALRQSRSVRHHRKNKPRSNHINRKRKRAKVKRKKNHHRHSDSNRINGHAQKLKRRKPQS